MKALVLNGPNQPFDLTEVPDPVAGPGEAVAKVIACGAGLTIQHVKAGRAPADFPLIIGHEITAEIVEVGPAVKNVKIGDAVTAYFYLNCGYCKWCQQNAEPLCENTGGYIGRNCDGGYAEYIKLPADNYIKLPEGLDHKTYPAQIGVITDALATPYKVLKRAKVNSLDTVAVFGAGGGLGIHQVIMAKWVGAQVIAVDTADDKFGACRQAGADEVVNPNEVDAVEALMDLTGGKGVDVSIDYVSAKSTLEAGVKSLGRHGRFVTLGGAGNVFEVDAKHLLENEIDVLGSRYVTKAEVTEVLDLVARGDVWPIVNEIRPMEEAEIVHDLVEKGEVTGRAAIMIAE